MSRLDEAADRLAEQLADEDDVAVLVVPRGLSLADRAAMLDEFGRAVMGLRFRGLKIGSRTIAGRDLDHDGLYEYLLVAWRGDPPPFFAEIGGER